MLRRQWTMCLNSSKLMDHLLGTSGVSYLTCGAVNIKHSSTNLQVLVQSGREE